MTKQTFVTLVRMHDIQFSWIKLTHGDYPKIKARLINGQILEIELVESYESTKLLYNKFMDNREWRQYSSNSFGAGDIPLKKTERNALISIKLSRNGTCIYFPVHWNKNIKQLISMKKLQKLKSFDELFADEELNHLIRTRAKETLARCIQDHVIFRRRLYSENDLKSVTYIAKLYEQFTSTNSNNCIFFPLTGISIDKLKFATATEQQKQALISEQIVLLEHYFRNHDRRLGLEMAVEAFITQSVPQKFTEIDNSLIAKTYCVYTNYEDFRPNVYDPLREDTYEQSDVAKAILFVENEQAKGKSKKGNYHTDRYSVYHGANGQQGRIKSKYCWQYCDYVGVRPRGVFHEANDEEIHEHCWKNLTKKCWNEQDLQGSPNYVATAAANQRVEESSEAELFDWKRIFSEIYTFQVNREYYMCPHCRGNHLRLSQAELDAAIQDRATLHDTEAYNAYCLCPMCDAGSWHHCG